MLALSAVAVGLLGFVGLAFSNISAWAETSLRSDLRRTGRSEQLNTELGATGALRRLGITGALLSVHLTMGLAEGLDGSELALLASTAVACIANGTLVFTCAAYSSGGSTGPSPDRLTAL